MKEISVFINDLDKMLMYKNVFDYVNDTINNSVKQKEVSQYLIKKMEEYPIKRLYFGNEFCQFQLPNMDDFEKACDTASQYNLKLTLVTPAINYIGINNVKKLLDQKQLYSNLDLEVVCNDWGCVQMISDEHPDIELVLGRTLCKVIKEFRYKSKDYENLYTQEGMEYIQSLPVFSKYFLKVLKRYNIKQCEFDVMPQGVIIPNTELNKNIYLPYTFITSGRVCSLNSLQRENRFELNSSCSRACQNIYHTSKPESQKSILKKGNTFYKIINESDITQLDETKLDRIIIQML